MCAYGTIYKFVGKADTDFILLHALRGKVLGHPFKISDFVKGSSSYSFLFII